MCNTTPETKSLTFNKDENIPFVENFCYLRTVLDFLMDDTNDIKARNRESNKALCVLNFI